jgi:hypothetical protein
VHKQVEPVAPKVLKLDEVKADNDSLDEDDEEGGENHAVDLPLPVAIAAAALAFVAVGIQVWIFLV